MNHGYHINVLIKTSTPWAVKLKWQHTFYDDLQTQ